MPALCSDITGVGNCGWSKASRSPGAQYTRPKHNPNANEAAPATRGLPVVGEARGVASTVVSLFSSSLESKQLSAVLARAGACGIGTADMISTTPSNDVAYRSRVNLDGHVQVIVLGPTLVPNAVVLWKGMPNRQRPLRSAVATRGRTVLTKVISCGTALAHQGGALGDGPCRSRIAESLVD